MYVKVWERKKKAGPPGPPPVIRLKFATKGVPPSNQIVFRNLFNGSARVVGYNAARGIYYVEFVAQGFKGIQDWTALLTEARFIASVLLRVQEIYADVPNRVALPGLTTLALGAWKGFELVSGLLRR